MKNSDEMKSRQPDRALHFVLIMALTMAFTVTISSLIWWFTSDRSYDILGRNINIGSVILIAIGMVSLGGRSDAAFGKKIGMEHATKHRTDSKRKHFIDTPRQNTLLSLNFLGAGLLCLFIGNLIILGL